MDIKRLENIKNKWSLIILIPLLMAVIGSILLAVVSVIPNSLLYDHAFSSAIQLCEDNVIRSGEGFVSPAGKLPYIPDNYTDTLIIESSYSLSSPSAALLNKVTDLNSNNQAKLFMQMMSGEQVELQSYSRYWMGFRLITRPLLLVTAYLGIRMIFAGAYYMLLIFAALTISRRNSTAAALAFAASCLLMEHYAVSASLQFSCCFLLTCIYIIILNYSGLEISDRKTFALFCAFGAATQFFDFYTYPLISCIFPLAVLVDRSEEEKLAKNVALLIVAWFGSYLAMWLVKLLFVTLFTSDNGFYDALQSVFFRFGIGDKRSDAVSYKSIDALTSVWNRITRDVPASVHIGLLIVSAVSVSVYMLRSKDTRGKRKIVVLSGLGILPLIWFAVAAQPTIIHTWFQYRLISATYFPVMLIVCRCFKLETIG